MTDEQIHLLENPFQANEIEWRIIQRSRDSSSGLVTAFVDSRAIQKRLDQVIGRENWQNSFIYVPGAIYDAKKDRDLQVMSCICVISIYNPERQEWTSKSDGAGNTDIEPIKGGISNAFKRAASMWGIGRYLYDMPNLWVNLINGKQIDPQEKQKMDDHYRRFLKKLSGSDTAVLSPEPARPAPEPSARKAESGSKSRFQKAGKADSAVVCQIIDLKVSKSRENPQTQIVLQMPGNQPVKGYIKGETSLKTGQCIYNPKIVTKTVPGIGTYNIIESYQTAA